MRYRRAGSYVWLVLCRAARDGRRHVLRFQLLPAVLLAGGTILVAWLREDEERRGGLLSDPDLAAAGIVFGGWIALTVFAQLVRAPFSLHADLEGERDFALAERNAAIEARDKARGGGEVPITVTLLEPVVSDNQHLFRLGVHNDGDRRAGFTARVTQLDGTTGPEAPFHTSWRGHTGKDPCTIVPDDEEWIDLALGDAVDASVARRMLQSGDRRYRPGFYLRVATETGHHDDFAPLVGVSEAADIPDRVLTIQVRIWHVESDAVVSEPRVRLWFEPHRGLLRPRIGWADELPIGEAIRGD